MSELPPGVDTKHFDELGTIEVIVLRCRARGSMERDASPSSFTDHWYAKKGTPGEDDTEPDVEVSRGRNSSSKQPSVVDAKEDDNIMQMESLFGLDGDVDSAHRFGLDGEAPQAGYWSWAYVPSSERSQPGAGGGLAGDTSPPESYQTWMAHQQQASGAPRPLKRVHFDHGPSQQSQLPRGPPPRVQFGHSYQYQPCGAPNPPYGYGHPIPQPHLGWNVSAPHTEYEDHLPPSQPTAPLPPPAPPAPPPRPSWYGPPESAGLDYMAYPPNPATSTWTPQPTYPTGANYGSTPTFIPRWQPQSFAQGPGYVANQPIPNRTWDGHASDNPGACGPTEEENNAAGFRDGNHNANRSDDRGLSGIHSNNNDNNWTSGGDGRNKDIGGSVQGNEATNNQSQPGDSNSNYNNDWNDNSNPNDKNEDGWDDNHNNDKETHQQSGGWESEPQNSQIHDGGWEDRHNNPPPRPITPPNANSPFGRQSSGSPSHGPLYGPHGAYYTVGSSAPVEVDPEVEEEPRYDVPKEVIERTGSSHQVQPGRGYMYAHKRATPEYIDSIDEPYARFVFKYRTKGKSGPSIPRCQEDRKPARGDSRRWDKHLHGCAMPGFGRETDPHGGHAEQIEHETGIKLESEPTGDEEKQKFSGLSKDELIEMLARAQVWLKSSAWWSHAMLELILGRAYRLPLVARFLDLQWLVQEKWALEETVRSNPSLFLHQIRHTSSTTCQTPREDVAWPAYASQMLARKLQAMVPLPAI